MRTKKYSIIRCKNRSLLDAWVAAVLEIMGLCQLCMNNLIICLGLFMLICVQYIKLCMNEKYIFHWTASTWIRNRDKKVHELEIEIHSGWSIQVCMALPKVVDQILLKLLVCFPISDITMTLNGIMELTHTVALFGCVVLTSWPFPSYWMSTSWSSFRFFNYHIRHYDASYHDLFECLLIPETSWSTNNDKTKL